MHYKKEKLRRVLVCVTLLYGRVSLAEFTSHLILHICTLFLLYLRCSVICTVVEHLSYVTELNGFFPRFKRPMFVQCVVEAS